MADDQIRAITFDADGTLWDFEATMRAALGHALAELRRAAPAAAGAGDRPELGGPGKRGGDDFGARHRVSMRGLRRPSCRDAGRAAAGGMGRCACWPRRMGWLGRAGTHPSTAAAPGRRGTRPAVADVRAAPQAAV